MSELRYTPGPVWNARCGGDAIGWCVVPIEPDDLVLVSSRGRVFYARVRGVERLGRLAITPLDASVRVRSAGIDELRGHWTHQGDPRPSTVDPGQVSFDHLLDR